jgi:hypothetical protein
MVGAETVGVGGRMSDPYVGNEPAGAAGAAGVEAAGPDIYVVPESVTTDWLAIGGGAAGAVG